jgi:hypothetical protein
MTACYSRRGATALITTIGLSLSALAQHTIIKRDGKSIDGQVLGSAGGQLSYTLDPSSGKESKVACADVLVLIDERLMVYADPCEAANKLGSDSKKNCASLVRKDNTVVKGNIVGFMDGYVKIKTLSGERNEADGTWVGQITEQDGVNFENPDFARKLMGDAAVVRAINDMSQCPSTLAPAKVGYSPAKAKPKWDAAMKKAALANAAKPKVTPPPATRPAPDRGLLEVLDFDTFSLIAMEKVERLGGYIRQIADKQLSSTLRDKAARQGMDLFEDPHVNTVQVSKLLKTGESVNTTRKVVNYLQTELKFHKYDNVDIKWSELKYASEFELQPDGSYRATISVQQTFSGKVDGVVTYGDITNKNVTVTLRQYEKLTDKGFQKRWDVFLGDIGVASTEPR